MKLRERKKSGKRHHLPGKTPAPNFTPDKEVLNENSNGPSNGGGSLLRLLREQKGLSQRALAKKLGISKTGLVHFESKSPKDVTVGELTLLSQALEISVMELFMHTHGLKTEKIERASLKEPPFSIDYGEGIRIGFQDKDSAFIFTGTLTLPPQKTLSRENSPRADYVSLSVLEGLLLVKTSLREYVIKEGHCLSLKHSLPYELYNPHQFKPLFAFLSTAPSFYLPRP